MKLIPITIIASFIFLASSYSVLAANPTCDQAGALRQVCCINTTNSPNCTAVVQKAWTAFGAIPIYLFGPVYATITIATSLAGGLATLLILYGAYKITTSRDDPKRLEDAKSMITSAIVGLLFIIFSVVIMRLIGVDILQIPGLTS